MIEYQESKAKSNSRSNSEKKVELKTWVFGLKKTFDYGTKKQNKTPKHTNKQ